MSILLSDSIQMTPHRAVAIGLFLLFAPLLPSCTTYSKASALPDDMIGPTKPAAMYSYAHDAKGKPFDLEPDEARGVYRTAQGTIISVFLSTQSNGKNFRNAGA